MRPEPDYAEYHQKWTDEYEHFNYDRSLSAIFLRKSHSVCERRWATERFLQVIEVGSGSGVHVDFVRHDFHRYLMTDRSTQMLEKARASGRWSGRRGLEIAEADATRLDFADGSFDRLIAAHVLEHLPRPHEVLREWARVVKPGGVLSVVLPCDPGLWWRIGRHLGPRATAYRAGINYDYWIAREHINPINNLVSFLRFHFEDLDETWYPTRIPSIDLNLFYVAHARV